MTYFAVGLLLFQVAQLLVVWLGNRQMRTLPSTVSERAVPWPSVSIVIAARDEEAEIERALQSVLHLDYPSLEVIVVNDRSSDGTGAILRRLQGRYPQLKVLDINELPSSWLGKNHALQQGARLAVGELLLFTDADIVFAPVTLKKAIQAMESSQLDHLTLG
ncbi:MAG: glycosyltransferase family 2 protein, partial [Planctomycetota bacterium]